MLTTYLEGAGLDVEHYEPTPGRRSVVARIEGSDPDAPSLCLMGHTDVVPVSPGGWHHDPFGGELIDGEVWGRGAVDMLNLTASMAVATKHLARSGWRPKGTLIYLGVADEEAGGAHGAEWLIDHEWDAVACDYVVTENGGWGTDQADGSRSLVLTVGEKGITWRRLTVRGTPGHGSMPYGADNALVNAAEVVRRLATYRPAAVLDDIYRAYVTSLDLPAELRAALSDPSTIDEALARVPDERVAKFAHACTHTTFSPNLVHGGVKTNVIPDEVVLEVDIRTLPGQTSEDVDRLLADALGPLADRVDVEIFHERASTQSPIDTPLAAALTRVARKAYPEATLLPQAHHRRHRRHVLPGPRARWPMASACCRARSPSPTSPAGSTATTSASTSSRCGSPRPAGSTCATTSWGDPAGRALGGGHACERAGRRARRPTASPGRRGRRGAHHRHRRSARRRSGSACRAGRSPSLRLGGRHVAQRGRAPRPSVGRRGTGTGTGTGHLPPLAVVGPGTAAACEALGLRVALVPERFVAEGLVEAFPAAPGPAPGRSACSSPRPRRPARSWSTGCGPRVGTCDPIVAYRTVAAEVPAELAARAVAADAVTFTSGSTVRAYVAALPGRPDAPGRGVHRTGDGRCRRGPLACASRPWRRPHDLDGLVAAVVRVLG